MNIELFMIIDIVILIELQNVVDVGMRRYKAQAQNY